MGFASKVSRSVRLMMAMAERIDRGGGRGRAADDGPAMARQQVVRGVAAAIERHVARDAGSEAGQREVERERLTEAFEERLDEEAALGQVPAEETITAICRDLALDAARMIGTPPFVAAARFDWRRGRAAGRRALDVEPGAALAAPGWVMVALAFSPSPRPSPASGRGRRKAVVGG